MHRQPAERRASHTQMVVSYEPVNSTGNVGCMHMALTARVCPVSTRSHCHEEEDDLAPLADFREPTVWDDDDEEDEEEEVGEDINEAADDDDDDSVMAASVGDEADVGVDAPPPEPPERDQTRMVSSKEPEINLSPNGMSESTISVWPYKWSSVCHVRVFHTLITGAAAKNSKQKGRTLKFEFQDKSLKACSLVEFN